MYGRTYGIHDAVCIYMSVYIWGPRIYECVYNVTGQ
jgi:hypothetical protein